MDCLIRSMLLVSLGNNVLWDEVNRQLDSLSLVIKQGTIQDVTFIRHFALTV
jgi:hypothetical protein